MRTGLCKFRQGKQGRGRIRERVEIGDLGDGLMIASFAGASLGDVLRPKRAVASARWMSKGKCSDSQFTKRVRQRKGA